MSMLLVPVVSAQRAGAPPRINEPVNESSLRTLRGNVSGLARPEHDRGEPAASTQLSHVRVVLSRSPEQDAALHEFMAEQLQKASPNYHKWLTPEQLGRMYGPADSDVAAVVAWLESHGLRVDPVSPARTNISFSGSVSQVEEALHTKIHSFEAAGQQFYANTSAPKIPSALANVVAGLAHLSTFEPRPHNKPGTPGMKDAQSNRLVPITEMNSGPELTGGSSGSYFLYLVPGDAATIYDTPNSLNANFSSGASYNGSGVTIGIGGDAAIHASTVVDYRTRFLGDSTAPIITNVDGVTAIGDTDEAYLDTEIAGGLASGAAIHFYTANSIWTAIQQALDDNSVDVFSLSFGACEMNFTTADNALLNQWWQQAAAQGIAVTVSAGDGGSAGCDNFDTETAASMGLAVSGLASTPYNIAVGGTDFNGLPAGFTTYVGTSNSATSFYRTAANYIPESTWNDSTSVDMTISTNVPATNSGRTNIVAGSGGASSCSTNTVNAQNQVTCVSGYPKPSWQTGTGVPNDGVRDIPDVSLFAGNGTDGAAWLVCTDDTGTVNNKTITANCATQSDGNFYFYGFGGTSASAPAFAGILALVQQKTGSRLGMDAQKNLYDLFNGANASSIFHDITVGNNSVLCKSGSPDCSTNTAGSLFLTGYNTTAGYDEATGLGSVDATQLLNYWGSATGSGAATVTVSPALQTISVTQSLSVPVTVAGNVGTPTGKVTLTSSGYSSGPQSLASGAYTFTIPAGSLPAGTDKLNVTYGGDLNYSSASGSSSITVNELTPTVTVTPASNSIPSNQTLSVSVLVAGAGPAPTGTVTLSSGGYTSSAQTLSLGSTSFTLPVGSLVAGTDTLTAAYSGDSNYNSLNGSANVTVTQAILAPTVTVTPASKSADSGQGLNVTVSVTGAGPTPTGTVTLSGGGYTSSAQTLVAGSYSFAIPPNSLAVATDTLTANYSGDGSYSTGTGSASVTVTASAFALAASAPSAVNPGGTGTSTISLTSNTAYTGTVTLTCALTSSPLGASKLPSCSPAANGGTITVTAGIASGTGTMNVNTTPAISSAVKMPRVGEWDQASGALLALLVFFGVPARRRVWRAMLGIVLLMLALGSLGACGGGSSNGTSNGTGSSGGGNPGTTAGSYTFTVTGTGSDPAKTTETQTFTLMVN